MRAYLCVRAMAALVLAGVLFFAGCRQFGDFAGEKSTTVDAQGGVSTNPNQVFSPTFAPPAGSYNATQNVAITSSTAGATVCYTTDGVTTPTCNASTGTCIVGTTYAATVAVSVSSTLMALACKAGMLNSTVSSAVYAIDSTPPTISLTAPGAGTYVTNAQVSYTTNEACNVASITWTQTGGTADPGSPRVQALTGSELTSGTHTAVTLANTPALVDGATYTLTFNCTDAAGNAATASSVTGVTFDGAVPVISAIAPANGAFMNTTQVSYTLSETCNTGNVTWTQTGGTADPGSPRVQAMSAAEKLAGAHNNITLASPPALVSGAVYSVSFNCTDFAGQAAATQTSTSVTFDNTLPVISAVAPAASSFVNNTQVSYTLSETCNTGAITWAQTGGTADVGAPHTKALTGAELNAGAHNNITITNNPTLVSGAIYTLTFTCIDAAGNSATPVTRTSVTYDNTGAVISAVAPASSAYVNNTQVSYTLSEACASGSVTWTRTGGTLDGSSHVQALTGAELNAGTHTAIILTNNPTLVDGSIYTVQFDCTDFAANVATPVIVNNVTYDVTVPVISGVAPVASTFVNHQQVTYTLSEACATGGINWTWTGGTAGSSFNQGLVAGELTVGVHGPFTISNNPTLVSGAIYTITFSCTDLAGNAATPITRTGVTFDNTPPTISIQNLRNNSPLHTGTVIGPATDNVSAATLVVEFNLDSTTWNAATYAAGAWKFGLPMGASTWRDRTVHTIQVRATDQAGNVTTAGPISVRKGNNRDIDGDGYGDIVVSGWQDGSTTGKSYIFYGSASGISNTTATSSTSILTGEQASARFGVSSAMADINGDGFADVIIGASYWDDGNTFANGRAYIFHGGAGRIATSSASAAIRIITGVDYDNFGGSFNVGDINNDGYADLLVAAVGAKNALTNTVGKTFLFYGGASGITQTTSTAAPVIFEGEDLAPSPSFGSSIVVGDFDADGFSDIAIGASAYNTNLGRAYLFYGSGASGFTPGTYMATISNTIATGSVANTFIGGTMAAGDLNGDGATDLATGGYGATSSTSKLFLFYGAVGSRPLQSNSATPTTTVTEGTNGFFLTTTIAIQDVNGDGYGDVIVGAHGGTANNGYTRIFFGQATPLTATLPTHAAYSVLGEFVGHQFGRGTTGTDINGDGYPDLMVGANFFATVSTVGNTGRAYIFHSSGTGPIISAAASANRIISGLAGTEFGYSFNR